MMRLFSRTPLADTDFRAADAMTIRAVRRERAMLRSTYPVDFDLYERTLLDKRCSGVLASVALARIAASARAVAGQCARPSSRSRSACRSMTTSSTGRATCERGGAWAMCVMRGTGPPPLSGKHATRGAGARAEVLSSGVLEQMLSRARSHMRAARRRAWALRARRLSSWAAAQEARLESLVAAEADSAGYAVRAHAQGLASGAASGGVLP